ncbi:ester cyclase [Saccharicrinis sp. FJH2]|uniref:nuclear transport factor 2 family protein n=1 Tax=Saccharicrinis sp. FJH65 TaxID=3344659 RepID=UPI0035F28651
MIENKNKENAIAFYRMAFNGDPETAVKLYVGERYIQHNPVVEDGPEGFIRYFNRMKKEYPEKSVSFLRSVVEGNLVALHTHQVWPGNEEYITMDFFRFDEKGKIVEHWDAIQLVPKESANNNGVC